VETAVLSFLVDRARIQGKKHLQGWFLPTKKNAPAQEFYPTHKFRCLREEGESTFWDLDLDDTDIVCPEWIRLIAVDRMVAQ
jgi:predicted enzyme involved in methoxymalonyl-ACP biosynthesis